MANNFSDANVTIANNSLTDIFTATNKSLVINGEGSWVDNKSKKPWKLQFVSKGNKSISSIWVMLG